MRLMFPFALPTLNEYINAERTNRYMAASIKKNTEQKLMLFIRGQTRESFNEPVFIKYRWIRKDARHDKDNIAFAKKFVQDALVKAGVLPNDGWKNIIGFKDEFELGEQNRLYVEITKGEQNNV